MKKFELISPSQALDKLFNAIDEAGTAMPAETVDALTARDRVLAQDIISPIPLPEFRRSTVDGYAVQAASVQAALASGDPLRVIGEVRMGEMARYHVGVGEAVKIHTGGHIPSGADAVVMVENTQRVPLDPVSKRDSKQQNSVKLLDDSNNYALRPMSASQPTDNIIELGEDVKAGEIVIRKGSRLREADLGGLASFGMIRAQVARQPRVALIASGDEVVPAETEVLQPGQVRSVNIHTVAALVRRNGGIPLDYGILPDRFEAFEAAAERALQEADVIVFMAGTSMSDRDFVPEIVQKMGQPGILQHGIAFRPGKPTLFALCNGKPVFGLPGNPVSTLVTAMLFLGPTLWHLQRTLNPPPPNFVRARLTADMPSPRQFEHWFPIKLFAGQNTTENGAMSASGARKFHYHLNSKEVCAAQPINSKSNLIFGLSRADGLVCAPIGVSMIPKDTEVDVLLLA